MILCAFRHGSMFGSYTQTEQWRSEQRVHVHDYTCTKYSSIWNGMTPLQLIDRMEILTMNDSIWSDSRGNLFTLKKIYIKIHSIFCFFCLVISRLIICFVSFDQAHVSNSTFWLNWILKCEVILSYFGLIELQWNVRKFIFNWITNHQFQHIRLGW